MTQISGTAFLVNYFRSKDKKLSGDLYSDLWIDEATIPFAEKWQREMNPLQSYQLSLRHRFFLGWVKKVVDQGFERIINLGSGFTTYTHLVEPPIPICDIDYQHIINYKAQKLKEFEEKKLIPHREVAFLPIDLNDSKSLDGMKAQLKKWVAAMKSLAILESIIYYLDRRRLDKVFSILSEAQPKGSLLTVNYLEPEVVDNSIFKKWMPFAKKNYNFDGAGYTFLKNSYFDELEGYRIIDFARFFDLEKRFTKGNLIREDCDNVFPETFIVLERI